MSKDLLRIGFVYAIIFLLIFSFIFNACRTAYYSHISFYELHSSDKVDQILNRIANQRLLYPFFKYTGLDTGYGFFSPNVASDFMVVHEVFIDGAKSNHVSSSELQTKEGTLRFANINSVFMDYLDSKQKEENGQPLSQFQKLNQDYLKLILKRFGDQKLEYENADSVNTKLFLYHFPTLKNYPIVRPKLIQIEQVHSTTN